MRTAMLVCLILCGCAMTPAERVFLIGGAVVTGFALSRGDTGSTTPPHKCYAMTPPGVVDQRFC